MIWKRLILAGIAKEILWNLFLKTSKVYFIATANVIKNKIGDDRLYELPTEELFTLKKTDE